MLHSWRCPNDGLSWPIFTKEHYQQGGLGLKVGGPAQKKKGNISSSVGGGSDKGNK